MIKSATISPCGLYRWNLRRSWDSSLPACNFIMLNPSTADHVQDDPTIRRCLGFARRFGCGSLIVTNLFAFRATKPAEMRAAADPIGGDNNGYIVVAADQSQRSRGLVICAWGSHGHYRGRGPEVWARLRSLGIRTKALKLTRTGAPCHPLYLLSESEPFDF
jgi:hypothetical protein